MNLVQLYKNQEYYTTEICGLVRQLPIRNVDDGVWIASNHNIVFSDVEFINTAGRELANTLREYNCDCLFTSETKSLLLVYEMAKYLNNKQTVVARKSPKAYMKGYIEEEVESITTRESQKIVLDYENFERIKSKRIGLIDDVVTTGGTMNTLEKLVYRARGRVEYRAAIWLEGPFYKKELIYLGTLPLFVTEEKYESLRERGLI